MIWWVQIGLGLSMVLIVIAALMWTLLYAGPLEPL